MTASAWLRQIIEAFTGRDDPLRIVEDVQNHRARCLHGRVQIAVGRDQA